jgi:hypothetical protein
MQWPRGQQEFSYSCCPVAIRGDEMAKEWPPPPAVPSSRSPLGDRAPVSSEHPRRQELEPPRQQLRQWGRQRLWLQGLLGFSSCGSPLGGHVCGTLVVSSLALQPSSRSLLGGRAPVSPEHLHLRRQDLQEKTWMG